MSEQRRNRKERKVEEAQDLELNLASIIDCFTVLITYLLVSASFIALGTFDVDVARPPGPEAASEVPEVTLTIEMEQNRDLHLKLGGKERANIVIPAKDGFWDFDALTEKLEGFKTKWPSLKAALLAADSAMQYKEVVKTIEITKKSIPSVTLGEKG